MGRKAMVFLQFSILLVFLGAGNAHAMGFGFYGQSGSGSGDITIDDWVETDLKTAHRGVGLVLDTGMPH
jgi:hypothetical protein